MTAFKNHPGIGGFPDRELTNFPNAGGAWKGSCVLLFRRSETHRFSQFIQCQNSMDNTQVLCFLILFVEDVDPDKVLRLYHGLDLEVKGFVKGVNRCIQVFPQFGIAVLFRCNFSVPPQFQVSTTQGACWWSERRCNTCCTS